MSATFSSMALDRVIECNFAVGDGEPLEQLAQAIEHDVSSEQAVVDIADVLGAIELALEARYVVLDDLGAEVAQRLAKLVQRHLDFALTYLWVDETLVAGLRDRLQNGHAASSSTDSLDSAAFGVFESYLGLTSAVREDQACRRFLTQTHEFAFIDGTQRPTWPFADAGFLLSPAAFAQAMTEGKVGGIDAPEVAGGFAALGYFDSLAKLRNGVGQGFGNAMLRHARWSHAVHEVAPRLAEWSARMTEWAREDGLREAAFVPGSYGAAFELLGPMQASLDLLVSSDAASIQADESAAGLLDMDTAKLGELEAVGRMEAARELARTTGRAGANVLADRSIPDWLNRAEKLVDACEVLTRLDDTLSAAALLAPLYEELVARGAAVMSHAVKYGPGSHVPMPSLSGMIERITPILARARLESRGMAEAAVARHRQEGLETHTMMSLAPQMYEAELRSMQAGRIDLNP